MGARGRGGRRIIGGLRLGGLGGRMIRREVCLFTCVGN